MEQSETRYDGFLGQMLQEHQGYEGFFTNIFGFLRRKTDFFQNSKNGEDIVARVGKAQFDLWLKEKSQREKAEKEKKERLEQKLEKEKSAKEAPKEAPKETPKEAPKEEPKEASKDDENKPAEGKVMPNKGNGSSTAVYYWTQTLEEVNFQIPLPREANKKNMKIDLGISKCYIASADGSKVYINEEWCDKIHVDESSWVIVEEENTKMLQVSLLKWKNTSNWWDCLIKGEPKIDTQKVNPEPGKLSDLDGEHRTTVEKMMFDMQQKQMGKPTSDELEKRDKLKDFMKAHPELDFSKAKFS